MFCIWTHYSWRLQLQFKVTRERYASLRCITRTIGYSVLRDHVFAICHLWLSIKHFWGYFNRKNIVIYKVGHIISCAEEEQKTFAISIETWMVPCLWRTEKRRARGGMGRAERPRIFSRKMEWFLTDRMGIGCLIWASESATVTFDTFLYCLDDCPCVCDGLHKA